MKKKTKKRFYTKNNEKALEQILSPKKFKEFEENFYWYDWEYLVELIYYVSNKMDDIQEVIKIGDKIDEANFNIAPFKKQDGHIDYDALNAAIHKELNLYFNEIKKLSASELFNYGFILNLCATAYNKYGVAVTAHNVAKELQYASKLLMNNKVDEYIAFAKNNNRFMGWWD